MIRVAFTIAFNAGHHLIKNIPSVCEYFDYWVIVEGASKNGGSTAWCKEIPGKFHNNGSSIDNTIDVVMGVRSSFGNIDLVTKDGFWGSKDDMVNAAIDKIKEKIDLTKHDKVFLWEIDSDEYWQPVDIIDAEKDLVYYGAKTGKFLCFYYVGKKLIAEGEWGEGLVLPYNRLWDWDGSRFKTHEPPVLESGNGDEVLLKQRFDHLAYYYDKDVLFKSEWYGGHEGLYDKWLKIQGRTDFPIHISELISGPWGKTNTYICMA